MDPDECPYRAYRDPFVCQVIQAHAACADGGMGLAILWPDPPAALVAGLAIFQIEMNRAANWAIEERAKKDKPPPG